MKKLMKKFNAKNFNDLVIELNLILETDENKFFECMNKLTEKQGKKVLSEIYG